MDVKLPGNYISVYYVGTSAMDAAYSEEVVGTILATARVTDR